MEKLEERYSVDFYDISQLSNRIGITLMYFPNIKMWFAEYMKINTENLQKGIITFQQLIDETVSRIHQWKDASIFFNLLSNIMHNTITIVTENKYVDREYRDSYYMHYSEEHKENSRWCKRLLLFSGNHAEELKSPQIISDTSQLKNDFIGSIVLKPLYDCAIGRSLLSPNHFTHLKNANAYIRKSSYKINYRELNLSIDAFPFRMRDDITTSCAEVTLLNIFDYYSSKYPDYRMVTPSEIHSIVRKRKNDRTIPTKGLHYDVISKVLHESGFSPKLHTRLDSEQFDSSQYQIKGAGLDKPSVLFGYYVESGMPIGIGFHVGHRTIGHSVLCIGHSKCLPIKDDTAKEITSSVSDTAIWTVDTNLLRNSYIIQDDASKPYSLLEKTESGKFKIESSQDELEIGSVVVPRHRRMYMDAREAVLMFRQIIYGTITTPDIPKSPITCGKLQQDPIVYRIFLASSGHYRSFRLSKVSTEEEFRIYNNLNMPHFVWVCELYTRQKYDTDDQSKVPFGEIVLDATMPNKSFDSLIIKVYNDVVRVGDLPAQVLGRPITLLPYTRNLDPVS